MTAVISNEIEERRTEEERKKMPGQHLKCNLDFW